MLQRLFSKPVTRLAERLSSSPKVDRVFSSLNELLNQIEEQKQDRGTILNVDLLTSKIIIFSDQHKGAGDLADDFRLAEKNYQAALDHYFERGFTFINLGDCEELWECKPQIAIEHNRASLLHEVKFLQAGRYFRIFGNHDLEWKYAIQQNAFLKPLFGENLKVFEGLLLKMEHNGKPYSIFLTHGHQGDLKSDGNAFSKWIVAAIWTPIQRYLEITLNSISDSFGLIDRHNIIMSDWSATKQNLIFISGHTHKPVFASLDHIDRLEKEKLYAETAGNKERVKAIGIELQKRMIEYKGKYSEKPSPHPSYFNTGCCCFQDGDITGIELEGGFIRLVKWEGKGGKVNSRKVLEESSLPYLFDKL